MGLYRRDGAPVSTPILTVSCPRTAEIRPMDIGRPPSYGPHSTHTPRSLYPYHNSLSAHPHHIPSLCFHFPLLTYVRSFTAQVKLHSVLLRTSATDAAPRTLKLFLNRADLDFEMAEELEPTQTLELAQTADVQEVPVKRALFARVQRLALFFEDNFGDGDEDVTRLTYLGFKGEWTALGRAPSQILYEAAPNPNDHALKGTGVNALGSGIGGRGPGA